MKRVLIFIEDNSIPLILGVLSALFLVNVNGELYHQIQGFKLIKNVTLLFFVNDLFMVLFFGIVCVEIVTALKPGGTLSPFSRAVNPLMGTLGGILCPVLCFFIFTGMFDFSRLLETPNQGASLSGVEGLSLETLRRGWGVTTATDIALAWLFAKIVFGAKHPAITFLLLLAIGDDAVGLVIIAIFYPDPHHPVVLGYLAYTVIGLLLAYLMRKKGVKNFWFYIVLAGLLSWFGLFKAHIHPALALVFVVPFLPTKSIPKTRDVDVLVDHEGFYRDDALYEFEHFFKRYVTYGLFFFGFLNSGVVLGEVNYLSLVIFLSFLIGKPLGIFSMSGLSHLLGFKLADKIGFRELFLIGIVAGVGLTVALFICNVAYPNKYLLNSAKMGALLSVFSGFLAIVMGKILMIKKYKE